VGIGNLRFRMPFRQKAMREPGFEPGSQARSVPIAKGSWEARILAAVRLARNAANMSVALKLFL